MKHLRAFTPDEPLHMRSDGRSLFGMIVPYMRPAKVVERNQAGDIETYLEQFARGSLTALIQQAGRRGNAGFISLNLEHDEGLDSRIGYAAELSQTDDGGFAEFRLYEGAQLDKVRSMLAESHRGLSVNFTDLTPPTLDGEVVTRVQTYIDHVAATPVPTYAGAEVLAMRSDGTLALETPALDELAEWLATQ